MHWILNFSQFYLTKCKISLKSNFRGDETGKVAGFETPDWEKLISRKIWVAGKLPISTRVEFLLSLNNFWQKFREIKDQCAFLGEQPLYSIMSLNQTTVKILRGTETAKIGSWLLFPLIFQILNLSLFPPLFLGCVDSKIIYVALWKTIFYLHNVSCIFR